MDRFIHTVRIISILISNTVPTLGDKFILGLNERLEHFGDCNIRISRSSHDQFTTWYPITAPVEIRGLRHNNGKITLQNRPEWFTPLNKAMRGSLFKYRKIKYACEVDLVIHLSKEPLEIYYYDLSDWSLNTWTDPGLFSRLILDLSLS